MKNINQYIQAVTWLMCLILLPSCKGFLSEEVYTEYNPSAFLSDKAGVDALLAGAYSRSRIVQYDARNYTYMMNEFCTDIAFETGGGLERNCAPYINFSWQVDDQFLNSFWTKMYAAISSANSVLSVANSLSSLSEPEVNAIKGEARFIRSASYYFLFNIFGPVPIIEIPDNASPDEIEKIGNSTPRASETDMVQYMIDDLTFAAENLPVQEDPIGKATKGSALAVLTKLYLHQKNWEKVVETAQKIIDLKYYSLYSDYTKLFSVDGENNKEFIYRAPCIAKSGYANNYMAHVFPPNYPIQNNWANFGAQFRTYNAFYDTFSANDIRRTLLITHYVNQSGKEVELYKDKDGHELNNVRSFKYWPDPNAVGESQGNDIVYIRYADILLCKAEALNELEGPNRESIDLINMIRDRAKTDEITLAQYPTKEALRDFILAERGREFYSEGLRREDLIRHGKFISNAISRGKNAKDYQVLYPIPLTQMQANSSLVQNKGYE